MKSPIDLQRLFGSKKRRLLLSLLVLITIFWLSPGGWLAVHNACKKDGGYEMNSSVFTRGYVLENGSAATCSTCIRDVANGLFEFVDVPRDSFGVGGETIRRYERYTLASAGDPACERIESNSILKSIAGRTRLDSLQCVAINATDSPAGYTFAYEAKRLRSWFGVSYYVNQYVVTSKESDEPLAAFRRYGHLPVLHRVIDARAMPMWSCENESPRFDPVAFRMTVLRDKEKTEE